MTKNLKNIHELIEHQINTIKYYTDFDTTNPQLTAQLIKEHQRLQKLLDKELINLCKTYPVAVVNALLERKI